MLYIYLSSLFQIGIHVIDADGYRANVGIILSNHAGRLLWARRIGQEAWQFPQGGIQACETPMEAMYRELREEIGLEINDIKIIGRTRGWLRYRLPEKLIRRGSGPLCIGQKQVWFLLRLMCDESHVCLDLTDKPEFDSWRWVTYWHPLREVVPFKRRVYQRALHELAPLLRNNSLPLKTAVPTLALALEECDQSLVIDERDQLITLETEDYPSFQDRRQQHIAPVSDASTALEGCGQSITIEKLGQYNTKS